MGDSNQRFQQSARTVRPLKRDEPNYGEKMVKRNLEIDTLRGIACILLVSYHVIGNTPHSGLKVNSGIYHDINQLLIYVRMPLFTFLSGIVYSYRPFSDNLLLFLKKKVRRLMFPMLSVGTIFALLQFLIPNTNSSFTNWSTIHIYPVAHFWFLESIFIIFCLVAILELLKIFESIKGFLLIFFLSIFLYVSNIHVAVFSISGAIYLFPYFLLGMFYQRYEYDKYLTSYIRMLLMITIVVLLILMQIDIIPLYGKRTIVGIFVGILSCSLFLSLKLNINTIAKIGLYSYSIYLFHVFFTASMRMLLKKLSFTDTNIFFWCCLAFGVIGPIITEILFNGTNFTRIAFLGKGPAAIENLWLTSRFTRSLRSLGRAEARR